MLLRGQEASKDSREEAHSLITVAKVHMGLGTSTKTQSLPTVGRGWHSCPVEEVAPHAEIQAIPFLRVCRTGWYAVIASLERLPEIQPSSVRKDPSVQLWSLTGALTCPFFTAISHSAASRCQQGARASYCPAWLQHLGAGNGRVLLCGVVNHKRKVKKENTLNHTKAPQKKGCVSPLIHVSE